MSALLNQLGSKLPDVFWIQAWGKCALQVDLNLQQRFDSLSREIGAAARTERELIEAAPVDADE